MNIAHIVSYLSLRFGGPPVIASKLVSNLNRLGTNGSLWGTGDEKELCLPEVPTYECRAFAVKPPYRWFRSPGLAKTLEREMVAIDLLHLHEIWSYPTYIGHRIGRRQDKPYLITVHGELEPWRLNHKKLKKQIYLKLIGNRIFRGAACLHAGSSLEGRGFREAGYKGFITIIPNGVDLQDFAELPERDVADEQWPKLKGKRVVHFLSRLSPEKGLDQFIPAWSDVVKNKSYYDSILVLSGPDDREYRRVVEGLVDAYGVSNSVLFTGMVTGRDKLALMSRSDIYVLPSYSEGFSISLLENLAAGKPVLITPGCNFPEVAQAGAGICVPVKRQSLAVGLRELLDMSDNDLVNIGSNGRDLVTQNYTWDTAARKLLTVYNCILEGKDVPLNPQPAMVTNLTV